MKTSETMNLGEPSSCKLISGITLSQYWEVDSYIQGWSSCSCRMCVRA